MQPHWIGKGRPGGASAHGLWLPGWTLHALGCATLSTSWGWLSTHLTVPHARDEPPSRAGPSVRLRCGHEARSADPCGVLPPPTSTLLLCSQVSEGSNGTVDVTNFHTSWQVDLVRLRYHLATLPPYDSLPYHRAHPVAERHGLQRAHQCLPPRPPEVRGAQGDQQARQPQPGAHAPRAPSVQLFTLPPLASPFDPP